MKALRMVIRREWHRMTSRRLYLGVCVVLPLLCLFFMATIHLYDMLTQPALIGPYESADRVWTGNMWPLYLMLLFAAELHASVGLYRLAIKWGWFSSDHPVRSRRRLLWAKHGISAFFITLGLVTLSAYVELGRNHAENAGERYVPTQQSAQNSAGKH